jgi:hypothetical protein
MSNTITIELSKEDRKLLEGLMGSVSLLASVLGNMQPLDVQQKIIQEVVPEHPIDAPTTHLEPVADPAPAAPAQEPTPEPIPEVKPVSLAEFQKAVTIACAKGPTQKAAAKEIINKYAASVSAVPEDKRAEAMAELAKI